MQQIQGSRRPPWLRTVVFVVGGAAVGLALGIGGYLLFNAYAEGRGGTVEEFQGLVSNVVPLGLLAGGVVGYLFVRPRDASSGDDAHPGT